MLVLEKFRASIALYKKYAQNQTLDRIRRKKSTIRMKVAKYRLVAQLGAHIIQATPKGTLKFGKFEILKFK